MALKSLLEYYQNELEFLVEGGKAFSNQYPDMAESLNFSSFNSNDPDIKRLIESIAFLNAKLQKRIDSQVPEISSQILHAIYPQFVSPIPSCCIMNFSTITKPNTGVKSISKNTALTSSKEFEKQFYTFKTTMNVNISPWDINKVEFTKYESLPYYIKEKTDNALKIHITQSSPYTIDSLVLYIHAPQDVANELLESIMSVLPSENTPVFEDGVKIGEIEPVGFAEYENLLPTFKTESNAYKTIMEYNFFPKKFYFFRINFSKHPKNSIIIPTTLSKEIAIKKENLLLNCTPAINLFEKNSEPININTFQSEYRLSPDFNNDKGIEIHTVKSIIDTNFNSKEQYIPYYTNELTSEHNTTFWLSERKVDANDNKSEVFVSLFKSKTNEAKILYAKLLCSQKNTHKLINSNESWNITNTPGNVKCINLDKPSEYHQPLLSSQTQWALISHLSINYFGFESQDSINHIKKLFSMYGVNAKINKKALLDIKSIKHDLKMSYQDNIVVPKDEISLYVNENNKATFLLGLVIANFFKYNTSLNTKMSFALMKQESDEVWKTLQIN